MEPKSHLTYSELRGEQLAHPHSTADPLWPQQNPAKTLILKKTLTGKKPKQNTDIKKTKH